MMLFNRPKGETTTPTRSRVILGSILLLAVFLVAALYDEFDSSAPGAEESTSSIVIAPKDERKMPMFKQEKGAGSAIDENPSGEKPPANSVIAPKDGRDRELPTHKQNKGSGITLDEKYRKEALWRIHGFRKEHADKGRPEVFGLRGLSWLYVNLDGMLLAAPEFEEKVRNKVVFGGNIEIVIRDVSGRPCNATRANMVSIYTRAAGPEVLSAVAEPVKGECKWIARYLISIPGKYTFLARLLHFNGMQDHGSTCNIVKPHVLNSTYIEELHEVPLYPYYSSLWDCCMMCTRFKDCRYSMYGTIRDEKRWGKEGSQCLFLKNSSPNRPRAFLATEVRERYQNFSDEPLRNTESRAGDNPHGTIWQLACGRDELLLRWAPCASYGAPENSRMRGTEDIILFEHLNRDVEVDPAVDGSPSMTLDEAQRESDAPIGDPNFKPVCDWNGQFIQEMRLGRWTRSPAWRYAKCGKRKPYLAENWRTAPPLPEVDDPICTLDFDLENLNDKKHRVGAPGEEYLAIWKSELSDNYVYPLNDKDEIVNKPFVPGPWIGYFRLHPSAKCRMPPLRSAKQVRECIIERNITNIHRHGDSIMEFSEHHLNELFKKAFPDQFKSVDPTEPNERPQYKFNVPGKLVPDQGRHIYFANMVVAHLVTLQPYGTIQGLATGNAPTLGDFADMRIWNTPPYMIWERRQYVTLDRTLRISQMIHNEFMKHDWYEIDYSSLSAPWVLDSTIERDVMHIIAHPMIYMTQLLVDIMCRGSFKDERVIRTTNPTASPSSDLSP